MIFNITFDVESRTMSLTSITDKNDRDTYEIHVTYNGTLDEGCEAYCVLENRERLQIIDDVVEIPIVSDYLVIQLSFVWEDRRFYSLNTIILRESDIIKA